MGAGSVLRAKRNSISQWLFGRAVVTVLKGHIFGSIAMLGGYRDKELRENYA